MSIYLSASSISDFIKCPQKVLYRFTKPFPAKPSTEMIVGKVAHHAIERGWRDISVARNIIDEWVQKERLSKQEHTHLYNMIGTFFVNFKPLLGEKDQVEYMFKIPMYDDIFLVGKMDRISSGVIYDWKTSSRISKKLGSDPQCIIYNYAYKILFQEEPNGVFVASLSTGELVPYRANELATKELFGNIIPRMIRTVKNETYERLGIFNHACFRCQYKEGCLGGERDVLDYPDLVE